MTSTLRHSTSPMRCPACSFSNPEGFGYCGKCGTALAGSSETPETVAAERRQLTVMFCDLESSTKLAEQLDPEDLREVLQAYQTASAEVIERYGGHIAQYLGDGLLVYFGYPVAHEDDAVRSVHAGLGILDALEGLHRRLASELDVRLAVRLGIHAGPVVAGEIGGGSRRERLALGSTPNVAARIQGLADPGTVVVSAAVHDLVRGFFSFQPLGERQLKGIAEPQPIYRALGTSAARTRFEAMAVYGLTPMVGRDSEIERLGQCYSQAREGQVQSVLISARAGIGKSRLVHGFLETLEPESGRRFVCSCSPYFQNSALFPLVQLLENAFGLESGDGACERLAKLERGVGELPMAGREAVPLFGNLLSLPASERYPPLALSPQAQRDKTLGLLRDLVDALAQERPVVFVLEDLHWVDPSTLDFLETLLDPGRRSRLLVLLTFRPSFEAPWDHAPHMTRLHLHRLAGDEIRQLARAVAGGRALPPEMVGELMEKTDGVPLFVEELTKMVLESGMLKPAEGNRYELVGPWPEQSIPTTLQGSLMARLDRLSRVKEVAQLGSVLGRRFDFGLLQELSDLAVPELERCIESLVDTEILLREGRPPNTVYSFRHALIQEAAYQSLLKSTRQLYHRRTAEILEKRFPALTAAHPELLAHHFTEAGKHGEAIAYWLRAGQAAGVRSACVEAARYGEKGLGVLAKLPESPARDRQELELRLLLGSSLMATCGYAAEPVQQAYLRARQLCRSMGDVPKLFPVLYGLWSYHSVRADRRECHELAEKLLELGEHGEGFRRMARGACGNLAFHEGDQRRAAELLETEDEFDLQGHDRRAADFGHDPELISLNYRTWCLTLSGFPDQALRLHQHLLDLCEGKIDQVLALVMTLHFGIAVRYDRREPAAVQELAERSLAICTEQGFPYWQATAVAVRGWALARNDRVLEGISLMQQGLAALRATGARSCRKHLVCYLADGFLLAKNAADGIAAIDEVFESSHGLLDFFYDAELHRLRGEHLVLDGREDEAEGAFRRALDLTREQGASWLELRAAVSLGRLWESQGRTCEARQMVAPLRARVSEGLETEDVRAADALLRA